MQKGVGENGGKHRKLSSEERSGSLLNGDDRELR